MVTWRVLLVGCGTVGRGAIGRLQAAAPELSSHGCEAAIVGVVDPVRGSVVHQGGMDPGRLLGMLEAGTRLDAYPGAGKVDGVAVALARGNVDVMFEATPTDLATGGAGLEHVRAALAAGVHVCTTNKGPIALAYPELRDLAAAHGAQLRCEGTVMSGTPVLNLVDAGLAGAGVRGVRGVLNGTCNFIISEMERGADYAAALADAQARGYAETDPRGDVEGYDAAAKVCILANLVLGAGITLADVRRQGITGLDAAAVRSAPAEGARWRLVGEARRAPTGWSATVGPRRLPADDPLARAEGVANVLVFETEALGDVCITGPGAGADATGHALVADLLAIHRSAP